MTQNVGGGGSLSRPSLSSHESSVRPDISRPAASIKMTSEINVKARIDCFVFGEDSDIENPGDFLIVASKFTAQNGSTTKGSTQEVRLAISGREIAAFLAQVTRANDLYLLNEDWLKRPATRTLSTEEILDRKIEKDAENLARAERKAETKAKRLASPNLYSRPGEEMTQEWIDGIPAEPAQIPFTGNRPAPRLVNPKPRL